MRRLGKFIERNRLPCECNPSDRAPVELLSLTLPRPSAPLNPGFTDVGQYTR